MISQKLVLVPIGPIGRASNVLFRANLGLTSRGETLDAAREKIAAALAEGAQLVFPENILACSHRYELIRQVQLGQGNCWVQVSAGLELGLHQKEMQAIAAQFPNCGFEILFDRAPHSRDLSILETIGFHRLRFTYVPCSNFEPLAELKKMRGSIFSSLSFYFREKKELTDTALSPSQIYVLLAKMRLELPHLPVRPANHIYQIESFADQSTNCVRRSLRREDYENESPRDHGWANATLRRLSIGRFTRPVVWILFGFFWLFKDPAEAALAGARRIYWVLNGGVSLAAREFRKARTLLYWQVFFRSLCSFRLFAGAAYGRSLDVFYFVSRELRKARTLLYWQVFFRSLCSFRLSAGAIMKVMGAVYGRSLDVFYFGYDRSLRLSYFVRHVFRNWILGGPARMRFYWAILYPLKHSLRYHAGTAYGKFVVPVIYRGLWVLYYSYIYYYGNKVFFAMYSWWCFCLAFARSPVWSAKEYIPWLYWPLLFPFVKSFWFLRFQWKKRLWGAHEES